MKRILVIIGLLAVVAVACSNDQTAPTTTVPDTTTMPDTTTLPDGSVVAEFETDDGETYRILLQGAAAEQARAAFEADAHPGIPNGVIQPGDGGVNTGHEWHIVDVEFADMTMELCDGTVSYVDDLGYEGFTEQHGDRFCPWGAELVDLIEG